MAEFTVDNRGYNVYDPAQALDESDLVAFEREIGSQLPHQLRAYYQRWNGGLPYPDDVPNDRSVMVRLKWREGVEASRGGPAASFEGMLSINADPAIDFLRTWNDFRHRVPKDFLCFARDPGGSLFLIGTGEHNMGKIYFWSRAYEADLGAGETSGYDNIADVADSFHEFLLALREEPEPGEPLAAWVRRVYSA